MAENRPAGPSSRYDQALAAANADIGELTGIVQARTTAAGRQQALADIRGLTAGKEPDEVAELFIAALGLLADRGGQARR